MQYIGARYVTKIYENSNDPSSAEWEAGVNYEPLTMVTYNNGSYLSKKDIPANIGDPANNPQYWVQTGFYNGQIAQIQSDIGTLGNLNTTDKSSLVGAINEVYSKAAIVVVSGYTGNTDAEKLQAAIDDACMDHKGGVVIVDNDIDLLNETIKINKGLYYSDSEQIRNRANLIIQCVNNAKIKKSGAGYFFSGDVRSGDILFIGCNFEGNVILDNIDDVNNRKNGNNVFDCAKLIRIKTIGCNFCLVKNVFDGELCVSTATNAQSIFSVNDTCSYSNAMGNFRSIWDAHFINDLIEQCNYGFKAANESGVNPSINHINIDNCCIEGCTEGAIDFSDSVNNVYLRNLSITSTYFEGNGINNDNTDIKLDCDNSAVNVRNNRFATIYSNCRCVKLRLKGSFTGGGNFVSGSGTGYFYYITTVDNVGSYIIDDCTDVNMLSRCNTPEHVLATQLMFERPFNTAADAGLTDCDTFIGNAIIRINNETVANANGITNGLLKTCRISSNAFQFLSDSSGNMYARARMGGIGWTAWKAIS